MTLYSGGREGLGSGPFAARCLAGYAGTGRAGTEYVGLERVGLEYAGTV
ncbi:hypothetical protein [Streptomyces sp. CBMA156]|nr:hypothetical protein [Streptomyces sp. CBMA156]